MTAPAKPTRELAEFRGDGLCPAERQILDLWDAGHSIEEITEASPGIPYKRVQNIVSQMAHDGHEFERMIRKGSRDLAARINECFYFGGQANA